MNINSIKHFIYNYNHTRTCCQLSSFNNVRSLSVFNDCASPYVNRSSTQCNQRRNDVIALCAFPAHYDGVV
jgi:hypothetical protein